MLVDVATNYNKIGSICDFDVIGYLAIAAVLHVTSTGLWVWALRYMEISRTRVHPKWK